jgi:hypothetical protein
MVLATRMRLRWWRNVAVQIYRPGMTRFGNVAVSELLGGFLRCWAAALRQHPQPPATDAPTVSGHHAHTVCLSRDAVAGPVGADTCGSARHAHCAGAPTNPDDLSRAGADAAKHVDDALQHNHSAINDADATLTDAILPASSSDQQGKARLQDLQQSIVDEVNKPVPRVTPRPASSSWPIFCRTRPLRSRGCEELGDGCVVAGQGARRVNAALSSPQRQGWRWRKGQ